jgi:magnesium transporter
VIHRLQGGNGNIRTGETSYLLYALIDVIVDNYFRLIYKLGDELETIEQLLYRRADKALMFQTQNIKREMITIRRAVWPERDKINDMIRSESGLINKITKTFLRDTYDHCMQIIDLVESYKDLTTSLVDMNLSLISHRMNEIMKVLTIISSIFIPLTFIAGIYGMNFAKQDPLTGKMLNSNMPELYMEHGYEYTMLGMLLIAITQLIYFRRKGWLNKS